MKNNDSLPRLLDASTTKQQQQKTPRASPSMLRSAPSWTAAVADVARVLTSLLGCHQPSPDDKLLDIGLTPSLADTLAGRLQETLNLNVDAGALLAGITVANLATMLYNLGKPTALLFAGLGSVAENIGMDLYEISPAARAVWDSADSYWHSKYGFSLLMIVRKNPSKVVIDFAGANGAAVHANYLKLIEAAGTFGKMLLPGLSSSSSSYTFASVDGNGLVFDPLFMRCALPVHAKAVYDDLCSRDLVPANSLLAGHSDGSFAVALSVTSTKNFGPLLECRFFSALLERNCTVQRNAVGKTNFGMVVTGPDRVGLHVSIELLSHVVAIVQRTTNRTAEIVNYNISNKQYVIAGDGASLECLRAALLEVGRTKQDIDAIVKSAWVDTMARASALGGVDNVPVPDRCSIMIPLKGVDIPLHSQNLKKLVPFLRQWFHVHGFRI